MRSVTWRIEHWLGNQETWIVFLALPMTSHVPLHNLCYLPVSCARPADVPAYKRVTDSSNPTTLCPVLPLPAVWFTISMDLLTAAESPLVFKIFCTFSFAPMAEAGWYNRVPQGSARGSLPPSLFPSSHMELGDTPVPALVCCSTRLLLQGAVLSGGRGRWCSIMYWEM